MNQPSKLRFPLRSALEEIPSRDAVLRVQGRLFERAGELHTKRSRLIRTFLLSTAAAALVVGTLLLGAVWSPFDSTGRRTEAGALLTEDGSEFKRLQSESAPASVRLADGSVLRAAPGTRVVGLGSTATEFVVLLERGAVDIWVTPGGPRRFRIEAKWARIEVVGTEFRVTRKEHGAEVFVREGRVLVYSPTLKDGVAALGPGEHLEVGENAPSPPLGFSAPQESGPFAEPTLVLPPPLHDDSNAGPVSAFRVESKGPAPPMPSSISQNAFVIATETFATLRDQADRARVARDHARAESLYREILARFPHDPRLGSVRYALALACLEQPGGAARAREALLSLLLARPAKSLEEDTLVRLIELEASLGLPAESARHRQLYLEKFPTGRHRARLDLP